jgi:hypothetical protein
MSVTQIHYILEIMLEIRVLRRVAIENIASLTSHNLLELMLIVYVVSSHLNIILLLLNKSM